MSEDEVVPVDQTAGGVTISDTETFNAQYEKVPYSRSQTEVEALAKAVESFEEDRANASFSKRNLDLGKMINCSLCGMRHRVHDPISKNSIAHGPQKFADATYPSRVTAFKGRRLHPHLNQKNLEFVQRVRDLLPYYLESAPVLNHEGEAVDKIELVKGIVRARLAREREHVQSRARNRQKCSRRINLEIA